MDFSMGSLAFWMFQVVFCATAATIVSGAMAERTKFAGYLINSVVLSAIIYPVFGSWAWGSRYIQHWWNLGQNYRRATPRPWRLLFVGIPSRIIYV